MRGLAPDWRSAAAWWVRRELGSRANGLIRILDVRRVAEREAWVSCEVDGCLVVVGLRHETVPGGDDAWFRMLYLSIDADVEAAADAAEPV